MFKPVRYRNKTYIRIPGGEIQYGHLAGSIGIWFRGYFHQLRKPSEKRISMIDWSEESDWIELNEPADIVCICGRHHPCRYGGYEGYGLGSYFHTSLVPNQGPMQIWNKGDVAKAALVLQIPEGTGREHQRNRLDLLRALREHEQEATQ